MIILLAVVLVAITVSSVVFVGIAHALNSHIVEIRKYNK